MFYSCLSRVSPKLLAATVVCLLACEADAVHRQVFLLGGQSNMVGLGSLPGHPSTTHIPNPLPEVRLYYNEPDTTPKPYPKNVWNDLAPGAGSEFGPEWSFGAALHATDPTGNYALIKYSRGGSDVYQDWNPDLSDNMYEGFQETVGAALQALTDAGDTYEIVGMLWTQGIRDGREGRTATQYQADLEYMIADVRSHYGADMPFFLSRLHFEMYAASSAVDGAIIPSCRIGRGTPVCPADPASPGYGLNGIRTGQEAVAANDPLVFMIDTDAMESDNSHFTSSGLVDVGEAFAASYFANVVVPEPGTLGLACLLCPLLMARRGFNRRGC